ncbi:MAG TPA: cell wall-binding repeat-containing protein [Desulfitobacteriaceae bacterium]|nr:cell wall-binding repeat-containing protein [Desulfitobacteriaceae bacterium]
MTVGESGLVSRRKMIIVFVLLVSFTILFLPAAASAFPALTRLAGQDRYETAKKIADYSYNGQVDCVVLTTGRDFADALSASVLAHKLAAPILLVNSTVDNSAAAFAYITSHLEKNGQICLIGGKAAICSQFTLKLNQLGYKNIEQIGGIDRYQTSVLLAERCALATGTPLVIASGENFPDALGMSSIAASKGWPILLTPKSYLPESVKTYIKNNKPAAIYIVGGTGVIAPKIESAIKALLPETKLQRLAGLDRYETAAQVLRTFTADPQTIYLASGAGFADALAGSVLAARNCDPIVLVDSAQQTLPRSIAEYLDSVSGRESSLSEGGSSASISSDGSVSAAIGSAASASDAAAALDIPASIVSLGGEAVVPAQLLNHAANIVSGQVNIHDPCLVAALDMEVTVGDIFSFPGTVQARLYDSTLSELPVIWNQTTLDTSMVGSYFFKGRVARYDQDVILQVTVLPEKNYENLKNALLTKIGTNSTQVGLSFYDLSTDATFSLNGSKMFLAASTAKLPIVMVLYDLIKEGRVREDQLVTYKTSEYQGGTGILQGSDLTKPLSFRTLAQDALIYSDNIAIIMIKDNACSKTELEARLQAKIGHALNNGKDNVLSADDALSLLKQLYTGAANGNTYYQQIVEWLKNTIFHDRLDKNIEHSIAAHKIGNYRDCTNDIGIFYTNKPYILAVYTSGLASPNNMISAFSDIAYKFITTAEEADNND